MRFLLYNIAYGTGAPRSYAHRALTLHRYLGSTKRHMERLHTFIEETDPDVLGLVELDAGSYRTGGSNHAVELARSLAHDFTYSSKYDKDSVGRILPVLRHQGNALFANCKLSKCRQHFLPTGFKRLVLAGRAYGVMFFLVHLALNKHARRSQLSRLTRIVSTVKSPIILAGDFNTFKGPHELEDFISATGLQTVNIGQEPTYPSWAPRKELDFILCSDEIQVESFNVLYSVRLSDHLPLIMDFVVDKTDGKSA